jgi:hypothetical protein
MLNPTGEDVAAFLGREGDEVFVGQCQRTSLQVRSMAESYTRGMGFSDDNTVPADLHACILSRAARVAVNPLSYSSESADTATSVDRYAGDWTRGELRILDAYRRRFK